LTSAEAPKSSAVKMTDFASVIDPVARAQSAALVAQSY
jgi:hypothetical protein